MNQKWRSYFNATILKRGRDCVANDCVKSFHISKNDDNVLLINAKVIGSKAYRVSITHDLASGQWNMECSCPFAKKGNYCKHEAAVLYEYENQANRPKSHQSADRILWQEYLDTVYNARCANGQFYFDIRAILGDLEMPMAKWLSTPDLPYDDIFDYSDLQPMYSFSAADREPEAAFKRSFHFSFKPGKKAIGSLTCTKNKLLTLQCTNPAHRDRICSHKITLIDAFIEFVTIININDATSVSAENFIQFVDQHLLSNRPLEENQASRQLQIIPNIVIQDYWDSCELRVGLPDGFKYKITSFPRFLAAWNHKESLKLGAKLTINFAADQFDAPSLKLLNEFYTAFGYEALLNSDTGYGVETKDVPINGRIADVLYHYAQENNGIPATINGDKTILQATVEPLSKPNLIIKTSFDKQQLEGINITHPKTDDFRTVPHAHGFEAEYEIADDEFIKLTPTSSITNELVNELDKPGEPFTIGRVRVPVFMNDILPDLKQNANVDFQDEELVRSKILPRPEFIFRFNATSHELLLKAFVKYGKFTLPLRGRFEGEMMDRGLFQDVPAETRILEQLGELDPGTLLDNEHYENTYVLERTPANTYHLLQEVIPALKRLGHVEGSAAFRRLKVMPAPNFSIEAAFENDLLNLEFVGEGLNAKQAVKILQSYHENQSYAELDDGTILDLTKKAQQLAQIEKLVAGLELTPTQLAKGKIQLPGYRAVYLDTMLQKQHELDYRRNGRLSELIENFDHDDQQPFNLPDDLASTLRDYQKKGTAWLMKLAHYQFGGILADEMGLGKTLQIIAMLRSMPTKQPALIVAPASLVLNWEAEFKKFAPQTKLTTIIGTKAQRRKLIAQADDYEVVLTSYDLLKRDIEFYADQTFSFEIIDEAQAIKNHSTAVAKAVKAAAAQHRFALTGTPIENRLDELWSIFDFIMPGYLFNHRQFGKRFVNPIQAGDQAALTQLQEMTAPFILRRTKKQVLKEIPDKMEETYFVGMSKAQQDLYNAHVARLKDRLNNTDEAEFKNTKLEILAEFTRIRQICCAPQTAYEDFKGSAAKLDTCVEFVENALEEDHKLLIFSQFTSMLALIKERLQKKGIPTYEIIGQTPKAERLKRVNDFNANDDVKVFLISLKAGGTGLNLTSADTVLFFDPWWNAAAEEQAIGRAHRMGQKHVVSVYRLIAKGTIEEKILAMQEQKRQLAQDLLSGSQVANSRLTKQDLVKILA